MTEKAEPISTTETIIANTIIFICAIGFFGTIAYGAYLLKQYDLANTRAAKINCIDRGGKVTEYAGGITKWACVGIERMN